MRISPDRPSWLLIPCLLIMPIAVANGQSAADSYTAEELQKHFQNVAEAYDMRVGSTQLQLRESPLMHWQNTVRKQEQGALYMWHQDGRPQVLGSIFTFQNAGNVRCRHEMISLAESPLKSRLDSVTVWSPSQAGVEWKKLEGVPPPSESAPRRLTRMRAIARRFAGTLKITNRQPSTLTLIPQPLVRYEASGAGVVDGAIFSLAVVTDPEILLMVEARKSKQGSRTWHYAAARAHYHALELKYQDREVWKADPVIALENTRAAQPPYSSESYFIFFPPRPLPAPETLR